MDRYWLITWTTYGTWLAGDARGFVSNVNIGPGPEVIHNIPGTPYDADMPALERHARKKMKGPPVYLVQRQADALIAQYLETAAIRKYELCAASVMFNHMHLVVGVPGDPDHDALRELFKGWATRALKKLGPVPPNGTWWTERGSTRKLPDEAAVRAGVVYVACKQPNPLATYCAPEWQFAVDAYLSQLASRAP